MARDIGGRVQPASGALSAFKGDVRHRGVVRGEAKTTSKDRYTLKFADLLKIREEALLGGGEGWVFQVQYQGSLGGTRIAVVDAATYCQKVIAIQPKGDLITKLSVQLFQSHAGMKQFVHWIDPRTTQEYYFAIIPWHHYIETFGDQDASGHSQ